MAWKQLSAPITLEQGKQYSALLHLSFSEKIEAAAAGQDAATTAIVEKFTSAGFTNVSRDTSNLSIWRILGTWPNAEVTDAPLPSEVATVWEWEPDQ